MGQEAAVGCSMLLLLAIVNLSQPASSFQVYWNIPSEICNRAYNISFQYVAKEYGISINDGDLFKGNKVTILYNPGLYPEIKGYTHNYSSLIPNLTGLEYINGGLPQDGNMMTHLNALEQSLKVAVPDTKNNGLIIIDMEHFGATWSQNFNGMEIYKIMSRQRVQQKNPALSTAEVEAQAILEYERAATNYIVKTIQYAKALRPYAKWGYYQYPQCFNRAGVDSCSTSTQESNNQMVLLWKKSDALYPSLYLGKEGTIEEKILRTRGRVREAKRLYKQFETSGLVIPYLTYKYYFETSFMDDENLENLIAVPKDEGADGVVIWGSSTDFSNRNKCEIFDQFVRTSLGPLAKKYISGNLESNTL